MKRGLQVALLASAGCAALCAQDDQPVGVGSARRGIRLQSVSISSGYYTSGTPTGFEIPTQSPFLGPTAMVAGAATVSGSTSGERSSFDVSYTPSYFTTVYSENSTQRHGSLNHRFGMNWRRKTGSRWAVNASAGGLLASIEQLYFAPGTLTSVATTPTTFDDLAGAILAGKITDAQLAAILTGSTLQGSPETAFPYGARILSATASLGVSWMPSSRSSFSLTAVGIRNQEVRGAGVTGAGVDTSGPSLPQMTTAGVNLAWSYALSPRTQFGVQAASTRTFSRLQRGYASNGNLSLGRTMSRRWFVQGHAGAGSLNYSHQQFATPSRLQYLYGASLGFKTAAHTFMASYDRTLGDAYGFGSGSTGLASGGWSWSRPGSDWAASAGGSYQQLYNTTFHDTTSWRVQASLTRSLSRKLALDWEYVYFQLPKGISSFPQDHEHGVLVSLVWMPQR